MPQVRSGTPLPGAPVDRGARSFAAVPTLAQLGIAVFECLPTSHQCRILALQ